MAGLLLLSGCSSGDYRSPGPVAAPSTTTSTAGGTATTAATELTVRGVVAGTFASARVITLRAPVNGVVNIALSDDSDVVRSNGARATLNDIGPGTTVEAIGRRSTPDTLLARRVSLLN